MVHDDVVVIPDEPVPHGRQIDARGSQGNEAGDQNLPRYRRSREGYSVTCWFTAHAAAPAPPGSGGLGGVRAALVWLVCKAVACFFHVRRATGTAAMWTAASSGLRWQGECRV